MIIDMKVDFTVERKEDGKEFSVMIGAADLTGDIPRFYIGTKEDGKWNSFEIIDGKKEFHEKYEVIAIG